MKAAGVSGGKYQTNVVITLVAVLYSTYAIYASGKDAVMGGTIVMALGFVLWGFIAPRFASKQLAPSA
jgi:putrescine:ornithine antiporter